MTPSGTRGVLNDAVSLYFAGATLASAFVARPLRPPMWCRSRPSALHRPPAIGTQILQMRSRGLICRLGEIDMIKILPPPTGTEEYRKTAEILRDLAAQARFGRTRNELFNYADNLDRLATLAEHQPEAKVQIVCAT